MKNADTVKRDCFAYKKKGSAEMCAALKDLYCKSEVYGFYKKSRMEKPQEAKRAD